MRKNRIPFQIKRPRLTLLVSVPVLLAALWLASTLSMSSRVEDMLPEDAVSVLAQKEFSEAFDAQDSALLVVRGAPEEAKAFLQAANSRIVEDGLAYGTLYRIPFNEVKPWALLYVELTSLEQAKRILGEAKTPDALQRAIIEAEQTFFSGEIDDEMQEQWLESDDGNTRLMIVQPRLDIDRYAESAQEFLSGMETIVEKLLQESRFSSLEAGITGGAFIQDVEGDRRAMGSLTTTALLTLGLVIGLIVLTFRRLLLPLVMVYPLLIGVLLTASFAAVAYGYLNTFSIGFAALLFGIGIDFSVHLLNRFFEARQSGLSAQEALLISYRQSAPGIVFGGITTAIAFYALLPARFKAFSQVGALSGTGIVLLCVVMLVLVPALIGTMRKNAEKTVTGHNWPFLKRLGQLSQLKRGWILMAGVLLMILLAPAVMRTSLVRDISQIYPDDLNSLRWLKTVEEEFGWSPNTLSFVVDDMNTLREATESLQERDDVMEVRSILTYFPEQETEKRALLLEVRNMLQKQLGGEVPAPLLSLLDPPVLDPSDLPEVVRAMYSGKNGQWLVELVPASNPWDPTAYQLLESAIQEATGRTPVGMAAIMTDVATLVSQDIPLITLACIVLAFLVLLVLFRNPKAAFVALLPVVTTLYMVLGLMPLLNIPLNLFSIMAFPLIIGIGIDSGIHLVHRIREDQETVSEAVMHTGKAIVITTLTTTFGFGSLMTIRHPGMQSLGATVALGLLVCMGMTLLLIPGLMRTKKRSEQAQRLRTLRKTPASEWDG